jgi:hypothetical protein
MVEHKLNEELTMLEVGRRNEGVHFLLQNPRYKVYLYVLEHSTSKGVMSNSKLGSMKIFIGVGDCDTLSDHF